MNEIKYHNSTNNDENMIYLSDEIHNQLRQIANVQIDHTITNYLHELIKKII